MGRETAMNQLHNMQKYFSCPIATRLKKKENFFLLLYSVACSATWGIGNLQKSHLLTDSWVAQCLELMQHLCLWAYGCELSKAPPHCHFHWFPCLFSTERRAHREAGVTMCVLTHRVFPVFQSNPVTPLDVTRSHSSMQSVSMFTLVSCKIWTDLSFLCCAAAFSWNSLPDLTGNSQHGKAKQSL